MSRQGLDRNSPVIVAFAKQDAGFLYMPNIGPFFFVLDPATLNPQNWMDLDNLLQWNLDWENNPSANSPRATENEECYERLIALVKERKSVSCVRGCGGNLLSLTKWF